MHHLLVLGSRPLIQNVVILDVVVSPIVLKVCPLILVSVKVIITIVEIVIARMTLSSVQCMMSC